MLHGSRQCTPAAFFADRPHPAPALRRPASHRGSPTRPAVSWSSAPAGCRPAVRRNATHRHSPHQASDLPPAHPAQAPAAPPCRRAAAHSPVRSSTWISAARCKRRVCGYAYSGV